MEVMIHVHMYYTFKVCNDRSTTLVPNYFHGNKRVHDWKGSIGMYD